MTACLRPGCTGAIEDGFCNVCGMAPAATPTPAPEPVAVSSSSAPVATTGSVRTDQISPRSSSLTSGSPLSVRGSRTTSGGSMSSRTGSSRTGSSRRGRLGAGLVEVPPVPTATRPSRPGQPGGAGGQAVLRQVRQPGRPRQGGQARPDRGVLPQLRRRLLVLAEAGARRPGRRAVRGGRLHRARRPRLDLPGPRPQRLRPLGGAQGPAGLRRRARRWPRRSPSAGSSPRSSTRASCGSTTSSSTRPDGMVGYIVMEYVGGKSLKQLRSAGAAEDGQLDPAAGRAGDRVRAGDAARARLPARARPAVLRLQAGQRDPDRAADQADRPRRGPADRRRRQRPLRHRRLPGARGRRPRRVDRARTCTPSRGRWRCSRSTSPSSERSTRRRCPTRRRPAGAGRLRVASPVPGAGHRPGSGPAVRLRRRDGRPAVRRAAPGACRERRRSRGPRVTCSARSAACSAPTRSRWPGRPDAVDGWWPRCRCRRWTPPTLPPGCWPRCRATEPRAVIAGLARVDRCPPSRCGCGWRGPLIELGDLGRRRPRPR